MARDQAACLEGYARMPVPPAEAGSRLGADTARAARHFARRCPPMSVGTWLTVAWSTMVATAESADFSVNSVSMCACRRSRIRRGVRAGAGRDAGASARQARRACPNPRPQELTAPGGLQLPLHAEWVPRVHYGIRAYIAPAFTCQRAA